MKYNYIINPQTGKKISIYGKTGQKVLNQYLNQFGGRWKWKTPDIIKTKKQKAHTNNKFINAIENRDISKIKELFKKHKSILTKDSLYKVLEFTVFHDTDLSNFIKLIISYIKKKKKHYDEEMLGKIEKRCIIKQCMVKFNMRKESKKSLKCIDKCANNLGNNSNNVFFIERLHKMYGKDGKYGQN